jgi:hypothetical protein
VNPALVVRDKEGKAYAMKAVNAMLLNEFLKEHRKTRNKKRLSPASKSKLTRLLPAYRKSAPSSN